MTRRRSGLPILALALAALTTLAVVGWVLFGDEGGARSIEEGAPEVAATTPPELAPPAPLASGATEPLPADEPPRAPEPEASSPFSEVAELAPEEMLRAIVVDPDGKRVHGARVTFMGFPPGWTQPGGSTRLPLLEQPGTGEHRIGTRHLLAVATTTSAQHPGMIWTLGVDEPWRDGPPVELALDALPIEPVVLRSTHVGELRIRVHDPMGGEAPRVRWRAHAANGRWASRQGTLEIDDGSFRALSVPVGRPLLVEARVGAREVSRELEPLAVAGEVRAVELALPGSLALSALVHVEPALVALKGRLVLTLKDGEETLVHVEHPLREHVEVAGSGNAPAEPVQAQLEITARGAKHGFDTPVVVEQVTIDSAALASGTLDLGELRFARELDEFATAYAPPVTGFVVDDAGEPVRYPSLVARPYRDGRLHDRPPTIGRADGSFTLHELLAGTEYAEVSVHSTGHLWLRDQRVTPGQTGVVFRLTRSARLLGRLLLPEGVTGSRVEVVVTPDDGSEPQTSLKLSGAHEADFLVVGMPAGTGRVDVRLRSGSWPPLATVDDVLLRAEPVPDARLDGIDLRDRVLATTLRLRDDAGPLGSLADIRLETADGAHGIPALATNPLGQVVLTLPRGVGALRLHVPGHRPAVVHPVEGAQDVHLVPE